MATIQPAPSQFTQLRRTRWRPRLRSGYLYMQDRLFYLYANKRAMYLQDAKILRILLAGVPKIDTLSVKIEGMSWSKWWVEGPYLVVSLDGFEGSVGYNANLQYDSFELDFFKSSAELLDDNMVHVSGEVYRWDSVAYSGSPTGKSFQLVQLVQAHRIGDAERSYRLPGNYVAGNPVVITDDEKLVTDGRDHQLQFRITEPKHGIEFNQNPNYLRNSHFAMNYTGTPWPAFWYLTDPIGSYVTDGTGFVGSRFLTILGTGMAVQEVELSGEPVMAQVWARSPSSALARLELALKAPLSGTPIVDQSGNTLGYDPDFGAYTVRKDLVVGPDWARIDIGLGVDSDCVEFDAVFPDIADKVEVRLSAPSGEVQFGATALRRDRRAREYTHIGDAATIEYETDPSGFYRHHPTGRYPYEYVWDVDMNPVNDDSYTGFLAVVDANEPVDEGLGLGAITWDEPATYGVDYPRGVVPTWPSGIRHEFGRRNLPYAKVDGYQKLRQTSVFDLENQPEAMPAIFLPPPPAEPRRILVGSPANAYRDPSGFAHMEIWNDGPPSEIMFAVLLDAFGNPIIGEWVSIVPSGPIEVSTSGAYTSHGGRIVIRVAPTGMPVGSGIAQVRFVHAPSSLTGLMTIDIA